MGEIFGITRSYNEADIIESSIRRMCAQVDHVIIGDNSDDGTGEILLELGAKGLPITVLWDDAPSVAQRDVMTAYGHLAREMGATWGVFFDIDEVWYASDTRIADALADLPDHILLAPARNLNHTASTADDPEDPDPIHRMGWRNAEMLPLVKVACRLRDDLAIGHGNHSASYAGERHPAAVNGLLESHHYPYRSPEQFIKRVKGAWPQLRDSGLPETHGAHMWAYGRHLDEFGEDGLRRWFENGMLAKDPASNPDLVYDPAPACPTLTS
jgi:hypothetical protein